MSEWLVALDFGTTATAVAVGAGGGGRGRALVLGDGSSTVPSSVFAESDGRLVVGVEADNEAELRLDAYEPTPKRRVGDGQIRLGERDFSVGEVIGAVMAPVLGEAMQQNNNIVPSRVVLTHPVAWRSRRRVVLAEALAAAGARLGVRFPEPVFVAEPVAAAQWYAHTDPPVPGEFFAVYDLGGGTFDTTVLQATAEGFDVIASGGVDPLGGFDFDAALFDYLGTKYIAPVNPDLWAQLSLPGQPEPENARERRRLQQRVGLLKMGLTTAPDKRIQLPGLNSPTVVTRSEYEALIAGQIDRTIGELEDTIADAGLTPEKLTAIYRIGGAARTPLVGAALDRFRVPVKVLDQPKLVVAQGAATPLTTAAKPQTTTPSAAPPQAKPQAPTAAPGKPPPARRLDAVAAARGASLAGVNPDSQKKAETPLTRFVYAVYSIVAITLLIGVVIGIVHFLAGPSPSSHNASQPAASHNDSPTSASQSTPESAAPSTTQPATGDAAPPTAGVAGKIIMLDPALSGGSDAPVTTQVPDGRGGTADCQRGGSSTGDGYPAHTFIWDTTLRIRAALNAMGARTAMTRGNDSETGACVDQRAAMGNALHPNATVSILAKAAWEKERGFFVNYAAPPLNNAQAGPSVQFAQDVAGQMLASGLTPDSSIGQGGIYGRSDVTELNLSQYPAIQIDLGNPQNPTDAQLMETPNGRQKYAEAVARGIAAFLTNHPN